MTAIVILAAGSSSRLGSPKQNLLYKGQTLLQRAIAHADIVSTKVVVVLGANADVIEPTIAEVAALILHNPDWAEGMASSIRLAVNHLTENLPETTAAIFMVCDQPFADATLLQDLIDIKARSEKRIVASAYKNTVGVPVLFNVAYFPQLLLLQGHDGAKVILKQHADDIEAVEFPLGVVDVDTVEDYEGLE